MIKDKIQIIKKYKKAYKNYFIILLKIYFNRKNSQNDNIMIEVKLKDGKKMNIPYGWVCLFAYLNTYSNKNISNLSLTENGISFYYKGHPVIIGPLNTGDIEVVFFKEDYDFLQVKDHDVIDIGMNIGDSAIYFALKGAKRIIGLEPYTYAFSFAEKNIKLNNLNNIIPLNAGYGKDAKIIVDDKKY